MEVANEIRSKGSILTVLDRVMNVQEFAGFMGYKDVPPLMKKYRSIT